eukprot:scaffold57345_cov20-Tisochrysis_lutea.AAC.3
MPAGSTTPFELVLVGGASGDGGPWGSAAPNTDATGGAAGEDHEDAPAAQPTPARAVDMGAQTGLSLGRPARARQEGGLCAAAATVGCPIDTYRHLGRNLDIPRNMHIQSNNYVPCSDSIGNFFLQQSRGSDRLSCPAVLSSSPVQQILCKAVQRKQVLPVITAA